MFNSVRIACLNSQSFCHLVFILIQKLYIKSKEKNQPMLKEKIKIHSNSFHQKHTFFEDMLKGKFYSNEN